MSQKLKTTVGRDMNTELWQLIGINDNFMCSNIANKYKLIIELI